MNFLFPYSEQKIKAQLKMASQRINVTNNKRTNAAKHAKREIASLLSERKDEKARIKVEHVVREDFLIESYELLGLMCELLYERIPQISASKECPQEMRSAVCSLIWACDYVDFPELKEVAAQLTKKFGDKFAKAARANEQQEVNERLCSKLVYKPPSKQLVVKYLNEIAKAYDVDFELEEVDEQSLVDESSAAQPFSSPSGFSVPMAPGSGLTEAYAVPQSQPAQQQQQQYSAVPAMTAEERAEHEQFARNQLNNQAYVQQQPYPAVAAPLIASLVFEATPSKTDSQPARVVGEVSSVEIETEASIEETHDNNPPNERKPANDATVLDDFLSRLEALKR